MQVNQYRQIDEAITDVAPSLQQGTSPTSITGIYQVVDNLQIVINHSATGGFWLIENSAALPGLQRQARDNEIYFTSTVIPDNIVAVSASPQTIPIPMANVKYALVDGDRVAVRITRLTAGYMKGNSLTDTLVFTAL